MASVSKGSGGLRGWIRAVVGDDLRAFMLVAMWTAYYYFSSVFAGIYNKKLVKEDNVSSPMLTFFHLVISVVLDGAMLRFAPKPTPPSDEETGGQVVIAPARRGLMDILTVFSPIAIFVVLGKLATYLSYGYVSMSLTHTVKASEPIFNVLLSALLFREVRSAGVILSLLPIAAGVTLASTNEVTFNTTGFLLAAAAAALKVMQNITTKKVMNHEHFSFFEIHYYCGIASLAVMAPILILQILLSDQSLSFPLGRLLVCAFLQYGSSISSYLVLSLVTHLTFSVTNTIKRLTMILVGIWYFGQPFQFLNLLGVFLAVVGVFIYNLARNAKVDLEAVKRGAIAVHDDELRPAREADENGKLTHPPGGPDDDAAPETPGVHHVGYRPEPADATDEDRRRHDPTYAEDIARTQTFN